MTLFRVQFSAYLLPSSNDSFQYSHEYTSAQRNDQKQWKAEWHEWLIVMLRGKFIDQITCRFCNHCWKNAWKNHDQRCSQDIFHEWRIAIGMKNVLFLDHSFPIEDFRNNIHACNDQNYDNTIDQQAWWRLIECMFLAKTFSLVYSNIHIRFMKKRIQTLSNCCVITAWLNNKAYIIQSYLL